MNSVQKVIKYLALAFAIFLSVSIIGGIITGLTGVSYILSGRDRGAVGEMQVYPIDGEISSMIYLDNRPRSEGFFKRVFR